MHGAINVTRELGETRLGRFHIGFALLIGAMLFIDGYDLFNAAYVAPYVKAEWSLQAPQIGLMLSIGLAGLAFGAILQGPLADRFGRRRLMLSAVWGLGLASLALWLWAPTFVEFCVLRGLLGVCLGMISPLAFVYVNEWAPSNCANRYATLAFVLPFSLGGIAAGLAGMTIGPVWGWRELYLIGVLAVPLAIAGHFLLPESVRHLVRKGRHAEVARLLAQARPERAHTYASAEGFVTGEPPASSGSFLALLGERYRGVTLAIWVAGALSLFCIHGLTGWLPSIVLAQGAGVRTAFGYGSLLMTMQIVGGAIGGWAADRYGRVPTMAAGFAGGAVALLLLVPAISTPAAMVVVALTGLFVFGAQAVMNNFIAMSYETGLRGTGVGVAVGVNRIGGVLGPLLIGLAQQTGDALLLTLGMLALAQLAAAAIFSIRRRALEVGLVTVAKSA
ncbi:MFS transporter [Caulobacter sp. CCNWLY153]|jgi:AAHS family benzoate transporter-like MFS transporter/AAHS family 4-hydroxybenzoate transporter-like MFS transporter|uniref:MFS transporter n=1 Tax=Caulobacter TaxID=75 RepID=UPI000D5842AD|nr:MFS transporter [Caulobacter radicis]PVM87636.1 MFS transporter [Caulobacter radicis]